MAVTEHLNKLVEESAGLNVRLAERLKSRNLDFLIWASPSGCRSPEEAKLWHPLYSDKPAIFRLAVYLYIISLYSILGFIRFFSYKGFFYNYRRNGRSALLIIPDEITDHSAEIRTDYLIEDAGFPIDKLAFSRIKNIGCKVTALSCFKKIEISAKLYSVLFLELRDRLLNRKISFGYLDNFIILLRWVISHSWFFNWDFYQFIKKVASDQACDYKILISMHEMHFYSKAIWQIASEEGKIGITAQHAMIIPEKLWNFPHKSETDFHCPVPDIFFVYSDEIKEMLKPFYPYTKFPLCCSPRFSKWRSGRENLTGGSARAEGKFVTFVSGIMSYDLTTLIEAIKNLLRSGANGKRRIKLRLHPAAEINLKNRLWMKTASASKEIMISDSSLRDDLLNAELIVGSNSTVLQEAALLDIPVLSVFSRDFVHYSVLPDNDGWNIPVDDISWERIEKQISVRLDRASIERFRKNMGIFSPDLTTKLLYSVTA